MGGSSNMGESSITGGGLVILLMNINVHHHYQSHFINRLSTTLAGSHDQIAGNTI